jgi:hypothetical protein
LQEIEVGREHTVEQTNFAYLGDADSLFSEHLEELKGTVRLAMIDPPYNTTSKFHHYSDRQSSDTWMVDRRRHAEYIRTLLTADGSSTFTLSHRPDAGTSFCWGAQG